MKSTIQLTIAGISGGLTVFALTFFLDANKSDISDSNIKTKEGTENIVEHENDFEQKYIKPY